MSAFSVILNARGLAGTLGDQARRGIDERLPGPRLAPVKPAGRRYLGRTRRAHHP
jgi:hypothetical protein